MVRLDDRRTREMGGGIVMVQKRPSDKVNRGRLDVRVQEMFLLVVLVVLV